MSTLLIRYVFVVLHVVTAAAWFGLAMRISSQARLVLNVDSASARELAAQTDKTIRLMGIMLLLTFAFSLAAFFLGGGFEAYGAAYQISLVLIVLLLVDQFALVAPAWRRVHRGVIGAQTLEAGIAAAARKRMAAGVGIGHILWLSLLILMFWNSLTPGI